MSEPPQRTSESESSPGEFRSRREADGIRRLEKLSGSDSRPPNEHERGDTVTGSAFAKTKSRPLPPE